MENSAQRFETSDTKTPLKQIVVGEKSFGGWIDITDPCYDKAVSCRTGIDVEQGKYTCCVWLNDEQRVAIIGIYKDGHIPAQDEMECVDDIGVDSGLAGFFIDKPDFTCEEWGAFIGSLGWNENRYWLRGDSFFSTTGYGDGGYDVFAVVDGDEATAVEIRFI